MRELKSLGLQYINNQVLVLDQQKLPLEEEWIVCESPQHMHDLIRSLKVRGAPLIGVAAALSLAHYAESTKSPAEILTAARLLKSSRPTAVNLAHCIDRQIAAFASTEDPKSVVKVAEDLFLEDEKLCIKIAQNGFDLIKSGDTILTHCNTGSLVTTGIGTALGIIFNAYEQGKKIHVYVDETRPLLQGGRLTTWELNHFQIPFTLICDNMAASLMRNGKIQKIIVGADRIAKNGDFANKIGTYNLAVLAHYHKIPFYVAAPYTTIDPDCKNGAAIHIEERSADEVRGVETGFGKFIWSLSDCPVYNPAFDVTPAELVTSFILDNGVFTSAEFKEKMKLATFPLSSTIGI